jgi:hypothetical protein
MTCHAIATSASAQRTVPSWHRSFLLVCWFPSVWWSRRAVGLAVGEKHTQATRALTPSARCFSETRRPYIEPLRSYISSIETRGGAGDARSDDGDVGGARGDGTRRTLFMTITRMIWEPGSWRRERGGGRRCSVTCGVVIAPERERRDRHDACACGSAGNCGASVRGASDALPPLGRA